jgi:hypothetical protein
VRGIGIDPDANAVPGGFKRFSTWMWRNADVFDFLGLLRVYNDSISLTELKVGFYAIAIGQYTTEAVSFTSKHGSANAYVIKGICLEKSHERTDFSALRKRYRPA